MTRTELRENIFKLLFLNEFNAEEEMPEQMQLYFDHFETASEKDQNYIESKYKNVAAQTTDLDIIINDASRGWKTTRMGKVDLVILRLAVYEMLQDDDVPVKVAINEAVDLAKKFGQDGSPSFINGILGTIARKEKEEK